MRAECGLYSLREGSEEGSTQSSRVPSANPSPAPTPRRQRRSSRLEEINPEETAEQIRILRAEAARIKDLRDEEEEEQALPTRPPEVELPEEVATIAEGEVAVEGTELVTGQCGAAAAEASPTQDAAAGEAEADALLGAAAASEAMEAAEATKATEPAGVDSGGATEGDSGPVEAAEEGEEEADDGAESAAVAQQQILLQSELSTDEAAQQLYDMQLVSELFNGFSWEDIQALPNYMASLHFSQGEKVIEAGEAGNWCGVMCADSRSNPHGRRATRRWASAGIAAWRRVRGRRVRGRAQRVWRRAPPHEL